MNFFKGWGNDYYKPLDNYKEYYAIIPQLNSVINEITNVTSQVEIKEVYIDDNTEVENSRYVELLNKPNRWQNKAEFFTEATINLLTQGACIQHGDYFGNGNLKKNSQLFNLNAYSLMYPKLDGYYWNYTSLEKKNLLFIENLPNGKQRKIPLKELNLIYDTINHALFGRGNNYSYNPEMFFCPISRIESILYDLQIIINVNDALASLSDSPVQGILSQKHNNAQNAGAQINAIQKAMIEANVNGSGDYGARIGAKKVIATNESLEYLSLVPDLKKTVEALIQVENKAKEDIRVKFHVPKDVQDATSGEKGGSTFENQHMAESRMVLTTCKGVTDKILNSLVEKNPLYFSKELNGSNKSRPTKLIGLYDHLPSVIRGRDYEQRESIKFQTESLNTLLDASQKAKEQGIELNLKNYMSQNGLEDLL